MNIWLKEEGRLFTTLLPPWLLDPSLPRTVVIVNVRPTVFDVTVNDTTRVQKARRRFDDPRPPLFSPRRRRGRALTAVRVAPPIARVCDLFDVIHVSSGVMNLKMPTRRVNVNDIIHRIRITCSHRLPARGPTLHH